MEMWSFGTPCVSGGRDPLNASITPHFHDPTAADPLKTLFPPKGLISAKRLNFDFFGNLIN